MRNVTDFVGVSAEQPAAADVAPVPAATAAEPAEQRPEPNLVPLPEPPPPATSIPVPTEDVLRPAPIPPPPAWIRFLYQPDPADEQERGVSEGGGNKQNGCGSPTTLRATRNVKCWRGCPTGSWAGRRRACVGSAGQRGAAPLRPLQCNRRGMAPGQLVRAHWPRPL